MNKKIVLAVALFTVLVASTSMPFAYAASSGPNNGGTFANDNAIGTISWSNPSSAQTSNNFRAVADLDDNQISQYLKATNFGFAIPTAATIDGIVVEVERHAETAGRIEDESVRLVKGGAIGGDNKAIAGQWGTADTYVSYGSSTDTWGLTWTPDDINASNFGVVFAAQKTSTSDTQREARVDHIRITVYFTIPSEGPSSGSSFAGNIAAPSGDVSWSNASNIATSDNNRATVTLASSGDVSNYLRATGFGFNIPAGSDIRGIEVKIERSEGGLATATIFDNVVSLVKAGTVTGGDKGTSSAWPGTDAVATYGGGTDLWGTTWTVADINDPDFGVVLSVGRTSGGDEQARVDHMTITVYYTLPPNTAPTADGQDVSTDEDVALPITLTGNANDAGQTLTFEIMTSPAQGTLTGFDSATGEVTYNPAADYNGADSFTFRVNDGFEDSSAATVSITVNAVNDAPVASDTSTSTDEDTPATLALTASDIDSGSVTFSIVDGPASGSLGSITPTGPFTATVEYTPNADFNGSDSFTYTANDGSADSNTATVSITVNPINDEPAAESQSVSTDEDTPVAITLTGTDPDGDALTYSIVSGPANGTLSGTEPNLTYTPDANFNGADSFTFKANDGSVDSSTATVSITVGAVNDRPVANDDLSSTQEDTPVTIDVLANDSNEDGPAATVTIELAPINGLAVVNGDNTITYTPNADFNGADSFQYRLSDSFFDVFAQVDITINSVNDAPSVSGQSVSTPRNTPLIITLAGSDTEGDSLAFSIETGLSQGSLGSLTPTGANEAQLTYTPNSGYMGPDSFTFKASDGTDNSNTETVSITVLPPAESTRPVVNISSPGNGDTINGPTLGGITVNISGTSSDSGSGVQIVEVRTETSGYSPATSSDGYATWTKSVTFWTAGPHQLVARATDNAGNMQWHVINVNIVFTP